MTSSVRLLVLLDKLDDLLRELRDVVGAGELAEHAERVKDAD